MTESSSRGSNGTKRETTIPAAMAASGARRGSRKVDLQYSASVASGSDGGARPVASNTILTNAPSNRDMRRVYLNVSMWFRQWLSPPRHLLGVFSITLLAARWGGGVAWRLIQQDRRPARQRELE